MMKRNICAVTRQTEDKVGIEAAYLYPKAQEEFRFE
jgi:hypothetical protein